MSVHVLPVLPIPMRTLQILIGITIADQILSSNFSPGIKSYTAKLIQCLYGSLSTCCIQNFAIMHKWCAGLLAQVTPRILRMMINA